MSVHGIIVVLIIAGILTSATCFADDVIAVADEPLMDWSSWEKYRSTVKHPVGYINAEDLENARENIKRYEWARAYAEGIEKAAQTHLDRITDEFLEEMLQQQTVLRCYQCPACRDKDLPRHPGGSWTWSLDDPDHIKCRVCDTVFPNDEYPETIVLECKSEAGKGQKFSFYGGETGRQWGYAHYRPSFSGMVTYYKVNWCKNRLHSLSRAYALTEKPEYAEATRKLLLRFAEVYPRWLIVSTYGEIADMDPHIAALNLEHLPTDELVYPPNKPDRKLYASYWAGCRAGGGGQEGYFTATVLEAYELTCNARNADGTPVYTEAERIKIERDLILESCAHLVGEKRINNKSVGNRIAVAMVGMALGHPGFVRFGLEGWKLTMEDWFLEDGCTPESPAYAMMSLHGIYRLGQAVRGYSDPAGYVDENGERIADLNLYERKYKLVWQRMFEGLQGNLKYPPYADSYRSTALGRIFAELLVANYPDNPQYLALLKGYAGDDLGKSDRGTAIFFRKPGLEEKDSPPLHFEDNFFPILCLGQMRTGEHGRKSLALLSATHYGGHHHVDSLNLYYWKDGHELLTDLGYLWDHPKAGMTRRTFSHNTGMVDLAGQKGKGRGGYFHLCHTGEKVKVMEASSTAYDKADIYRRTLVQIDHDPNNSYFVDIFRLHTDKGSRDLVYHGPNSEYEVSGIELQDGKIVMAEAEKNVRFGLRFAVTGEADEIYVDDVSIKLADGTELAKNPSAAQIDEETGKPANWNHYSGSGKAEWGAHSPGRTDDHCAYFKILGKGNDTGVNQALMHGDTNGYTGPNALEMPDGARGTVSFWIRGRAATCSVGTVAWPSDPSSPGDRVHKGLGSVPVTDKWTRHSFEFGGTPQMDLENVKSAHSPDTWTAAWKVADDLVFSACHCGQRGEITYIGDGWGQRDHRNTDLGVTVPYIIRRHQPDAGVSAFCTVYEAHKPGAGLVKSAFRLAVPEQQCDNVALVLVETTLGTDLVVSQLEPAEIEVDTPAGKLQTDAAVAVISMANGRVSFAAMAEGSLLRLSGADLEVEELQPNSALSEQVSEEGA